MPRPNLKTVLSWCLPWLALSVAACEGSISGQSAGGAVPPAGGLGGPAGNGGSGSGPGGALPATCTTDSDASPLVLRRLTKAEYQLTLQQLFALTVAPDVSAVPDDGDQEGFRTIAALQNVSDLHLRAYLDIASSLASELLADDARRAQVLGCEPADACLTTFIEQFGKLAYRRALTPAEASDLGTRAQAAGLDVSDRFRYVIEALLSSPSFLFRVEGVATPTNGLTQLAGLELASRLSFTLWGSSPNAELLASAERGELDAETGLASAAESMLKDPRSIAFYRGFFKQWLDFEALRRPNQPPAGWDDALMPQMIQETEALLDDFAWGAGQSLTKALTANYTYVTPALATFYGLSAPGAEAAPQKVTFPSGHPREGSGLLTHAALISAKSDADLIAYRGKWLRAAFLCEKLEVPAGLLEGLQSELSGLSYVEVIQKRNSEQPCAGCHVRIDPLGAGFVQYDGAGHYDGSISPSEYGLTPRFEGAANPDFQSLAELASELEKMPELSSCIAKKVFTYTQGRFPGAEDECALAKAGARFAEQGFGFPALLTALIQSPSFRLRRAPQ